MDEQLQEDWLDRRLREEMPYIDDAGFTARVVQKLPAPVRRHSWRAAILISITLLASVVTYLASDGGRFLIVAAYRFAAMPLGFIGLVAICGTLIATAVAASAALAQCARNSLGRGERAAPGEDLARLLTTSRAICSRSAARFSNFCSGRR